MSRLVHQGSGQFRGSVHYAVGAGITMDCDLRTHEQQFPGRGPLISISIAHGCCADQACPNWGLAELAEFYMDLEMAGLIISGLMSHAERIGAGPALQAEVDRALARLRVELGTDHG